MHHIVLFIFDNNIFNMFLVQFSIMSNSLYVARASSIFIIPLLVVKSETKNTIIDNIVENR